MEIFSIFMHHLHISPNSYSSGVFGNFGSPLEFKIKMWSRSSPALSVSLLFLSGIIDSGAFKWQDKVNGIISR